VSGDLAIVSGSDAAYFPLLRGMVRSVTDKMFDFDWSLFVFDAGLTVDRRRWLEGHGATLLRPDWPYAREVPGFVAMLASRPRLPDLIPGYAAYMWLDADAWVQQFEALATYRREALDKGFAVTPEVHPAYNIRELGAAHQRIRAGFGRETVVALEGTAPINLGVFAGAAGAPHWAAWRKRVETWLAASKSSQIDFNADQTAFNMVVHVDKLDTALLPARYNWICHTALPKVSPDGATLLEPVAPYAPLGVVHMTLWTKKGAVDLATPQGGKVTRPLTYGAEPLPDGGRALPDFAIKNLKV